MSKRRYISDRVAQGQSARAAAAKLTAKQAAAKLRAAAQAVRRQGGGLADDDSTSLELIASDVAAGRTKSAFSYASRCDTAVREEIPLDVWIYLGGTPVYG